MRPVNDFLHETRMEGIGQRSSPHQLIALILPHTALQMVSILDTDVLVSMLCLCSRHNHICRSSIKSQWEERNIESGQWGPFLAVSTTRRLLVFVDIGFQAEFRQNTATVERKKWARPGLRRSFLDNKKLAIDL